MSSCSQFKCPKCPEVFPKLILYRKHMAWHRTYKNYKCDKCLAGFNVETNLRIHVAMHGEYGCVCPVCKICFQRFASLKAHLISHEVEEGYSCEECTSEFEKEDELIEHYKVHSKPIIKDDCCPYCSVKLDDAKKYKEHISQHVKVKRNLLSSKRSRRSNSSKAYPHVCNICAKSFSRISLLDRHMRVHSGEKPFICCYCSKRFNQKGTLKIHAIKHTGVKPFHCTLCSAKFNQKGNLRIHIKKTHTAPLPGVQMYKCSYCACIFKRISSLNVHITKSHASVGNAGQITNVMSQLKELERQVSNTTSQEVTSKYKGDSPNETKSDSNIMAHVNYVNLAESLLDGSVKRYMVLQKKVNDVRWYVCSYCDRNFKKPSDLIRHTRIHTGEKPFACKQCEASFSLKSTLFCHMKTHKRNNNFCGICSKKIPAIRGYKLHSRKNIICTKCHKRMTLAKKSKSLNRKGHSNENTELSDLLQINAKKIPLNLSKSGSVRKVSSSSSEQNSGEIHYLDFDTNSQSQTSTTPTFSKRKEEVLLRCHKCLKLPSTPNLSSEDSATMELKKKCCTSCEKLNVTTSSQQRHIQTTIKHRLYMCQYCDKNFKNFTLYRKHTNTHSTKETGIENNILTQINDQSDVSATNDTINTLQLISPLIIKKQPINCKERGLHEEEPFLICKENDKNVLVNGLQKINEELQSSSSISGNVNTNLSKDIIQDISNVQTVFIACNDLQLGDNLYIESPDSALYSSPHNGEQDRNVFRVVSSGVNGELGQITDCHSSNGICEINKSGKNTDESNLTNNFILSNKIIKVQNYNAVLPKTADEKSNVAFSNIDINNEELNLLFSFDSESNKSNTAITLNNNLHLSDVNLSQVHFLNMESQPDTEIVKNSCDRCKKVFTNKTLYLKHMQECTDLSERKGITSHQCSFCSKAFKKQSDLIRHVRTHTGEKPFGCNICKKKFALKSTLISHQRTHNPVSDKKFNCVVCNSFFTTKSSLKVHMTVHTGDKAHQCSFCPMKFRTTGHKKSHEANHHFNSTRRKTKEKVTNLLASVAMDWRNDDVTNKNEIILSENADDILIVQQQLPEDQLNILEEADHNNIVVEQNQLEQMISQELPSNFLIQDNILQTSLIQLDDGTVFNVKALNGENRAESNKAVEQINKPRNLECDVCHKKYASKDVLRKHKKNHGINKKFPCSRCDKGFDEQADLRDHEKIHLGVRPYSCMYCTNSFSRKHSLTTHIKRIHAKTDSDK